MLTRKKVDVLLRMVPDVVSMDIMMPSQMPKPKGPCPFMRTDDSAVNNLAGVALSKSEQFSDLSHTLLKEI